MKLWLSKGSEVPVQEQLSAQIVLGIVSADLEPGERLPSTSEIARRFHIHANTVRAAYRELAARKWVEWRPGSGFYVRALDNPDNEAESDPNLGLDRLIAAFLKAARGRGYLSSEIQSRVTRWLTLQPPDHILVIEPDVELRAILVSEIHEKVGSRVEGASIDACANTPARIGALCVTLLDHASEVRAVLPPEAPCLFLRSNSIPRRLAGERKPSPGDLITVVSRWPEFLHWARATLAAVGIDAAALDLRDARQAGWDRGLTPRSFIVTDSLLALQVPKGCAPRIFQLIADESLAELRDALPAP